MKAQLIILGCGNSVGVQELMDIGENVKRIIKKT